VKAWTTRRNEILVRGVFFILSSAMIPSALPSAAATDSFVEGIVVAENGQPLQGISVYGSNGNRAPFIREIVKTDKDGHFRLEQPVEVVHIRAVAFRPLAVMVQPGVSELRVVLEEEARNNWVVHACSNAQTRNLLIGNVKFSIPKRARRKEHRAEDAFSYSVYFSKHSMPVELGSAALYDPYVHDDRWILKSTYFGERWIKDTSDRILGMDAEGETKDGTRWRRVALRDVTASYEGISAESAKQYDALIDSACINVPGGPQ
jgi:hypothetical protein